METPSQRRCDVCVHYTASKYLAKRGWCENLKDTVLDWWTGCVMNKTKEENIDEQKHC